MVGTANRIPCPKCRAEGRDSGGNHLRPFEDGRGGWCFHGHGTVFFDSDYDGGRINNKSNREVALSLSMVNTYPILGIPSRKISESTCKRYGVRSELSEVSREQEAVYYPYIDDDGVITGYKKRALPKDFSTVGKIKGLFGKHVCKKNAKFLIIVEGEQDVLAGWEILTQKGKDYNIVSIPNGASETGTLDKTTLSELEWIVAHEKVLLLLDNDPPGKATAQALAEALVSQCTVHIGHLPRKDTAKCWEDGEIKGWWDAVMNSQPYRPECIVEGKDVDLARLKQPKQPGFKLPWPKLQKMTWGIRKGEITTLTAASGIGKSTFAMEVIYEPVLEQIKGSSVAIIALETSLDDVARRIVAMDNQVPWSRLAFHPDSISDVAYESSYDKYFGENRVHLFKHWGSIDADTLRRKMLYFAKVLKVDFILLDHVSMVVAGSDTDERKDIDKLYEAMTQIVVETGVGIIPIIHLKRVQGKKFNKGDEVELTDLRGSAGAEQMSWNVWALERNQQADDGTKDLVRVRVLKNRTMGFTGLADTLRYDHQTGRLSLHTVEEFENE